MAQSTQHNPKAAELGKEVFGEIVFHFLKSEEFLSKEKEAQKRYITYIDDLRQELNNRPVPLRR